VSVRSGMSMMTVIVHGHVERMDKSDWVSVYGVLEAEGTKSKGRSTKTWNE